MGKREKKKSSLFLLLFVFFAWLNVVFISYPILAVKVEVLLVSQCTHILFSYYFKCY